MWHVFFLFTLVKAHVHSMLYVPQCWHWSLCDRTSHRWLSLLLLLYLVNTLVVISKPLYRLVWWNVTFNCVFKTEGCGPPTNAHCAILNTSTSWLWLGYIDGPFIWYQSNEKPKGGEPWHSWKVCTWTRVFWMRQIGSFYCLFFNKSKISQMEVFQGLGAC